MPYLLKRGGQLAIIQCFTHFFYLDFRVEEIGKVLLISILAATAPTSGSTLGDLEPTAQGGEAAAASGSLLPAGDL